MFTQLQKFTLFRCYHNTLTFSVSPWKRERSNMAGNMLALVLSLLSRLIACLDRLTYLSYSFVTLNRNSAWSSVRPHKRLLLVFLISGVFLLILPCFSLVFRVNWRLLQSLIRKWRLAENATNIEGASVCSMRIRRWLSKRSVILYQRIREFWCGRGKRCVKRQCGRGAFDAFSARLLSGMQLCQ